MKRIVLNKDTRIVECAGGYFIGNISNGSFVMLDNEGKAFIEKIVKRQSVEKTDVSKNIKRLMQAGVSVGLKQPIPAE